MMLAPENRLGLQQEKDAVQPARSPLYTARLRLHDQTRTASPGALSVKLLAAYSHLVQALTCCFAKPWCSPAWWESSGSRPPRRHSAFAAALPIRRAVRSHKHLLDR